MVLQSCLIFPLSTRQRETSFNASFMCSLLGFYSSYFFQSHCRDLKPKKKKITIQSSFVDIGHRCHIVSCADGKRRHLIPKQQEKKKKRVIYCWEYVLKVLFGHTVCCLVVLFHMLSWQRRYLYPQQKKMRESKMWSLHGKLLLENFCTSLNLPVNLNTLSYPVKTQWDFFPSNPIYSLHLLDYFSLPILHSGW